MNNTIDILLDNDEKIIKEFKPNKKRFVLINSLIFSLLIGIGIIAMIVAMTTIKDIPLDGIIVLSVIIGFAIIILLLTIISYIVTYKKTYYCYTNKRLIIRTGFIGTDYKSLEISSIGAINVKVDFLDKLTKNTGTLSFGSMSAPISEGVNKSLFEFKHIDNPYELYKELKSFIAESKK